MRHHRSKKIIKYNIIVWGIKEYKKLKIKKKIQSKNKNKKI
jgi:hypothetical protein